MDVLILHGIGGHPGIHWQQWLHDELAARAHRVAMPALPNSDRPDRDEWLATTRNIAGELDLDGLTIIAHSLGVVTALDFIEQSPRPVRALVSVSGFGGDYGAELNSYFMATKSADFATIRAKLGSATVFYGDNDPYVSAEALAQLADELRVEPHVVPGGGHLNTEAGYERFPALLDVVLKLSDFSQIISP